VKKGKSSYEKRRGVEDNLVMLGREEEEIGWRDVDLLCRWVADKRQASLLVVRRDSE
jgi:hypothetical protein